MERNEEWKCPDGNVVNCAGASDLNGVGREVNSSFLESEDIPAKAREMSDWQ